MSILCRFLGHKHPRVGLFIVTTEPCSRCKHTSELVNRDRYPFNPSYIPPPLSGRPPPPPRSPTVGIYDSDRWV